MNIEKLTPVIQLLFLFVIAIIAVNLQSPPDITGRTSPLDSFSAERAFEHLEQIAQRPHSGGTAEHRRVRDYIRNVCIDLGCEVNILDTTAYNQRGGTISASHVSNILAIRRGKNPSKSILVLSHYDSQPNTPGAADDGAGVVAMLETIRALNHTDDLNHDVIFLFTDQEEVGLLGAEAFVNTNPLVKNTGVLINFESRGNSGAAYTFEVNSENGWIIRQFARGAPHPIANSMAYEVYKVMPNDTDFSKFRKDNYTGFNQANVDGFVNYHSMTDTPERIDKRIIQHHGDNLLGMIRHLDSLNLEKTKSPDLNFFNPVGKWLIYYPTSYNIPLVMLCFVLFTIFLYLNRAVPGFNSLNVLYGTFTFILTTGIVLSILFLLLQCILLVYPHYTNFYANNFYNEKIYFWAFLGIPVILFGVIYRKFFSSQNTLSQFCGVVLLLMLFMIASLFLFPTASYVFYYPLIWVLLFLNAKLLFKSRISPLWTLSFGLIPMVLLWAPIVYLLFVVFSLVIPYISVLLICLLLGMVLPILKSENLFGNGIIYLGTIVLLGSILFAHFRSKPSKDFPLQTNLSYVLSADDSTAHWFSNNRKKDSWTTNYLDEQKQSTPLYDPYPNWKTWTGAAPVFPFSKANMYHQKRIINDDYEHEFIVATDSSLIGFELFLYNLEDARVISINGRHIETDEQINRIILHATHMNQTVIKLRSQKETDFRIQLIERYLRIPLSWLEVPLPEEFIHGPGTYSDAYFRKNTYSF